MTSISTLLDSTYSNLRMLDATREEAGRAAEEPAVDKPTRTQDPTVSSENAASGLASQLSSRYVSGVLDGISSSTQLPSTEGAAATAFTVRADPQSTEIGDGWVPLSAVISQYASHDRDDDTAAA